MINIDPRETCAIGQGLRHQWFYWTEETSIHPVLVEAISSPAWPAQEVFICEL